jgi:hypothetical protein
MNSWLIAYESGSVSDLGTLRYVAQETFVDSQIGRREGSVLKHRWRSQAMPGGVSAAKFLCMSILFRLGLGGIPPDLQDTGKNFGLRMGFAVVCLPATAKQCS